MFDLMRPALSLFLSLTLLTGIVYPLAVTAAAWGLFPRQAAGSLIIRDGKPLGATPIGQEFTSPQYFWGRPSATSRMPYDAAASAGSNLGPLNPALEEQTVARADRLRAAHPTRTGPVPLELVTASASGLDPHITPAGAEYQIERVAAARGLPVERVAELVRTHVVGRSFGILGEPRVNVLELNVALDELARTLPVHTAPAVGTAR